MTALYLRIQGLMRGIRYVRKVREERFIRYWHRMLERTLRREQLVLFVSEDIETSSFPIQTKAGLLDYYTVTLQQLRAGFNELGTTDRMNQIRATHSLPEKLEEPPASWEEPFSALADECSLKLTMEECFRQVAAYFKQI